MMGAARDLPGDAVRESRRKALSTTLFALPASPCRPEASGPEQPDDRYSRNRRVPQTSAIWRNLAQSGRPVSTLTGHCGSRPWTSQLVKVFGCRLAYENRPSTNPRGCVNDLWGFRLFAEGDDGDGGRRSRRGGCSERDFARGVRWNRCLPPAMFTPSVKVLAKGARMAVAGTMGVAARGDCLPCRVTTTSWLLCERGAARAAASSARRSR